MSDVKRPDKWDVRFLQLAQQVATWSKDRSTKCGTVLTRDRRVLSTGYNGFPPGMDDENDRYHERPLKYFMTEHAERNAIFNAARHGVSTLGSTAYVWGLLSCSMCVRALLSAGVTELVTGYDCRVFREGRSPHMDPMDFETADDMCEKFDLTIILAVPDGDWNGGWWVI